ncbi:MAG TPA: nucleotidyltransferase [Thermoanaerobaculia bacterium]|nr:nucleotidyltransferase [Thermoanaerobaculia bacterium]
MKHEQVCRLLDAHGVRYAVIGAIAVAARGAPRSTIDFDLFTTDRRVLDPALWREVPDVDIRRGDADDPLAGVIRIGRGVEQIDLVVGKSKWQEAVIERSDFVEIEGIGMRLPRTSDLILLKLAAGGPLDQQDVIRLLEAAERSELIAEVNQRIVDLDDDARALWARITS